jgi:hypothetical protein
MHWAIKSHPHHLRYAARIVLIDLVDSAPAAPPACVPRLDTDHWQARFGKAH